MPVSWIPADPAITSLEASLSAALGQLSVDVAAVDSAVAAIPTSPIVSIQTGYVNAASMTGGAAGEDRWSYDVTLSAVVIAKTKIHLQGAAAVGTTLATTLITGRMTSTTNLRLSTLDTLDGTPVLVCRYYAVEYS